MPRLARRVHGSGERWEPARRGHTTASPIACAAVITTVGTSALHTAVPPHFPRAVRPPDVSRRSHIPVFQAPPILPHVTPAPQDPAMGSVLVDARGRWWNGDEQDSVRLTLTEFLEKLAEHPAMTRDFAGLVIRHLLVDGRVEIVQSGESERFSLAEPDVALRTDTLDIVLPGMVDRVWQRGTDPIR